MHKGFFCFREKVRGSLTNRGTYGISKEVIQEGFEAGGNFQEMWMGMYMYKTDTPDEHSTMLGDFAFEIDEEDESLLIKKVLAAVEYLFNTYKIKTIDMQGFVTNRSLWITIPSKLFGCFGRNYLHKIHKKMAFEINDYLLSLGHEKGLDLSIYRWNGLRRALGSFLQKSKRRVTKFDISTLEEANTMEDIRYAKFDNFANIYDVEPNGLAVRWFKQVEKEVWNEWRASKNKHTEVISHHEGMEQFIENGELPFNRNLHVFSVAAYLKDKGFSLDAAIAKIQDSFKDAYVSTKEALRTINSAFKGSKHFSPKTAQGFLANEIFSKQSTIAVERDTFIVPRNFIEKLQEVKAPYQSYKFLFSILHNYQTTKTNYTHSLTGDKNKKRTLAFFEKLVEAGLISYTLNSDTIEVFLVHKDRKIYKSHIVVPNSFVNRKLFKSMKKEFVLFVELWRSGMKFSDNKTEYHFNVKAENLCGRLKMTMQGLNSLWASLVSEGIVTGSKVKPNGSKKQVKKERKMEIRKKLQSVKSENGSPAQVEVFKGTISVNLNSNSSLTIMLCLASLNNIKCNYSTRRTKWVESYIDKG